MGTKDKAKTSKIVIFLLVAIITLTTILSVGVDKLFVAQADSARFLREEKIFSDISVEDDFDEDSLLVVMDKYISDYNKNQSNIFDSILDIENIEDLTYITGNLEEKEFLNRENFRQILKISLKGKSKQNVINAINEIQKLDGVMWAGANEYASIAEVSSESESSNTQIALTDSSDMLYTAQWGLHGTYGINIEEAWKYTKGSKSIKVGIIDTGIADHEDLRPNLVAGWDFYNDNEITTDDLIGHGTHVAGIIGANSAKENGLKGVCPNVQLVPLQVLIPERATDDHCIDSESVIKAIIWATNNDIDILNYSAGYKGAENVVFRTAIENYNGLFVCAAGNGQNGTDNDVEPVYPANYSRYPSANMNVISVGSINANGEFSWFSNYGQNTVSLLAPGGGIWSTYPTGCKGESSSFPSYANLSGSSMAAPFVTGVAALLYSMYINNSHELSKSEIAGQVGGAIINNTTTKDEYYSYCNSSGRLNAAEALRNMRYRSKIMSDFGFQYLTYKWYGRVDLMLESGTGAYEINEDGYPVVHWGSLQLAIGTSIVYNAWEKINSVITIRLMNSAGEYVPIRTGVSALKTNVDVGLVSNVSYSPKKFNVPIADLEDDTYTLNLTCQSTRKNKSQTTTAQYTFVVEKSAPGCVATGTLITLADGRQVPVETLTGDETLLVWNIFTGKFDYAPIIFIDKDEETEYNIINLYFSDGTSVKVIDEHGFWDFDLNRYVFLREDAAKYIGHYFNKQTLDEDGNPVYTKVRLVNVELTTEYTAAWSPVTYGHLCYYVNGMLSMPGATGGLINIFDVDPETMTVDSEAYNADVERYGLFTYEEFAQTFAIPQEIFEAFGGKYLKVAIGKGLTSEEELSALIARYSVFWETSGQ